MDDQERGDAPSASKISAIIKCRGYHQANLKFPYYGEKSAADEGTIRHQHEEDQTPLDDILDDEQRLCALRCRQALEWCRDDLGLLENNTTIEREVRLWWDGKWSGQLDYLETWSKLVDGSLQEFAFLADYKTLRGDHDPAHINQQLLAQAVLVQKNYPKVSEVFVALIEPFKEPMYTTASYSSDHLRGKGEWISDIVDEAMSENAPRTAGPSQCKWCSAVPFCPEARNLMKVIMEGKYGKLVEG
jgi:hypothetical protein